MRLDTPKQAEEYVRETANSSSTVRMLVAAKTADDISYYQGHQFTGYGNGVPWINADGSIRTVYNPDSHKLRVTQNETTKHVIASFTATDPESIEAQVPPTPTDSGIEATVSAQVREYAVNACLRNTRFLARAKYANFMRCVIGAFGIGWRMAVGKRKLALYGGEVDAKSHDLSCFAFHPLRLILDPFNPATDLRDHDAVIYEDVWTISQLHRFFPGVEFDEGQMSTVGDLTPNERTANERTQGAVFQQYAYHSRTKGARVYQVHVKDESGRFPIMWCGYCYGRDSEIQWVNADEPTTPFGGDGLPFAMLYGHPRPESHVGISDVGMLRDDQDKLNLAATWEHRIMRKYAGYQWVVDKRWFGRNVNDSDMEDKFTNQVGGIITGDPRSTDRSIQPPQLMVTPQPNPTVREMQDRYDVRMGEKVFRSQESRGIGAKSHVPDAAYERLLAEGDRVANVRVAADVLVYEQLAMVALGTVVAGVHRQNPSTLAMLRQDGFGPEDLMELLKVDPAYPACEVIVPLSAVRRRSTVEKKQALDSAMQAQAITPDRYRRGLAELDLAIDEEDNHMRMALQKEVAEIIRGKEWEPFPLREYTEWFMSQLVRARWDRAVRSDPEAVARIGRALMVQEQFMFQQQAMAAMAANPPQPAPEQAQAEQQQPGTVAELIAQLAGGEAA